METSNTHSKQSRSAFARFGRVASAGALAFLIGAFAIGTAQADGHGHHGGDQIVTGVEGIQDPIHGRAAARFQVHPSPKVHHGGGHEERHENHGGRGYNRGPDVVYGNPDYYYEPAPDYYYQPEPYDYGYYPPSRGYYPPGPSEGIREFFGL